MRRSARRLPPLAPLAVLAMAVVACAKRGESGAPRPALPEPLPETCATRLSPRDVADGAAGPTPLATPPAFAPFRSTVIVQAELPLGGVRQALEAKVPIRVAAERDHDIGIAGRLEYTVDRGPFTVRVERDTLVVESILHGRAQACAKGSCYASCAPEARATARVPLRLNADYKLRTSDVRIDVTRGCEVRALGGFVTVDVTPMLRSALAAESRNVQASIDRELPDLRPEATRMWTELSQPRPLPLGMCVVLAPEGIVQGPASGTVDQARLRFGLHARPELRVRCGAAAVGTRPLPRLEDDPSLGPAGDVRLAIVLPGDAPARALEGGEAFDLGRGRARVSKATGDAGAGFVLELAGEVCGEVQIGSRGVAWSDAQSLHLASGAPLPVDATRLADAGVDPARLAAGIEHVSIPVPIAVGALETLLPELARGLSNDKVSVAATVESARPDNAGLRGTEVLAIVLLRGAITIQGK